MYRNLLNYLAFILLLPSCNGVKPHISAVCEENNIGNNIVKWETAPLIQGNVKVYASTNPEVIPENNPIAIANIADQRVTLITPDPAQRYYYTLLFNEKYRVKIATRNVNIPGIQNFRDLGGYPSYNSKRKIRWGKIYRSSEINKLQDFSFKELRNLNIQTIIDLRTPEELKNKETLQPGINVVHIPIPGENLNHILQGIQNQTIHSDTVYRFAEAGSRGLIRNHTQEFRKIFDVLLDEANYPLIIHCTSGKGRTGIVTALIMSALNINADIIMEDYKLSNKYFDITKFSQFAYQLPVHSQEAITTLFSARESYLFAAKEQAEQMYGEMGTYLEKGIGLKKDEIKKLQSLLLEKNK